MTQRAAPAFALAAAAILGRAARGAGALRRPRRRPTFRPCVRLCNGNTSSRGALRNARAAAAPPVTVGVPPAPAVCADAGWDPSLPVDDDATIFALSSGSAGAVSGVAVIRLSGPSSFGAVQALLRPGASLPPPRRAALRSLVEPETGLPLDSALVLLFASPASFTGEDCAELQVHGSRAVVRATLRALSTLPGLRPAGRGEFARRAFEQGRLDLTAAEGLADLLAAETPAQRVQALRAAGGGAREVLERWRETAKGLLANAEAVIDFGDDVGDAPFQETVPGARDLRDAIADRLAADGRAGEVVRDGLRVAIVGPPNVGKSSLLNALAARDVAIVGARPGTTRDVLAVALDVQGFAVTVADTAGLREAPDDEVEAEGIRRARSAAKDAHVVVAIGDASPPEVPADAAVVVRVANKCDRLSAADRARLPQDVLAVSLLDAKARAEGVERVLDALAEQARVYAGDAGEAEQPVVTRARHRYHLERAGRALSTFVDGRCGDPRRFLPMDIAAEELRTVCRELGEVTGAVRTEEVLDVIFRDFCIGK